MNEKMLAVVTDQAAPSRGCMRSVPALPDPLRNFSGLPDEAFVRLPVVLMLLGVSRATVWRLCKSGALPAPKKLGSHIAVWSVRDLRNVLNSGSLWTGSAPA
jgi:predicted DNA-binding transcriptional regulator AlpA